ncbi:hypothetical protein N825_27735 [Skermanella stibiiresistens SB22]|uniref:Uncharacterized protein n=1 Tax=Skermanella stibiiresistens SB22 TaxID=1385369 RepID=W9HC92_9PROT|nr:hypothetical protein N825_27735 [Skermanella stibiiresistens SB22]
MPFTPYGFHPLFFGMTGLDPVISKHPMMR